jgi:hypothetical protein
MFSGLENLGLQHMLQPSRRLHICDSFSLTFRNLSPFGGSETKCMGDSKEVFVTDEFCCDCDVLAAVTGFSAFSPGAFPGACGVLTSLKTERQMAVHVPYIGRARSDATDVPDAGFGVAVRY